MVDPFSATLRRARARSVTETRSQPTSCRRRVSAIALARKESSEADVPNDHSVANPIARHEATGGGKRSLRPS
jgi:hypothetical protein